MNEIGSECGIFNMGSPYGTPEGEVTQQDLQSYIKREDADKLAFKGRTEGRSQHVEDSADWGFLGMQGFGESEQVQTTGAQLLDFANTSNAYCVLLNADTGSYRCNMTNAYYPSVILPTDSVAKIDAGKGKTLRFQVDAVKAGTKMTVVLYGNRTDGSGFQEAGGAVNDNYVELTAADNFTEINRCELRFNEIKGPSTDTATIYSGLMLYFKEGNTVLPFEPFTDYIPSPSPAYPQEIVSKCGEKQLFDFDAWKSKVKNARGTIAFGENAVTLTANEDDAYTSFAVGSGNELQISVKAETTYTLSWECSGSDGRVYAFCNGLTEKATSIVNSRGRLTFTTLADTTFITFRVGVSKAGGVTTYSDIMLNEGEEPGAWAPYGKYGLETVMEGKNLFDVDKFIRDCLAKGLPSSVIAKHENGFLFKNVAFVERYNLYKLPLDNYTVSFDCAWSNDSDANVNLDISLVKDGVNRKTYTFGRDIKRVSLSVDDIDGIMFSRWQYSGAVYFANFQIERGKETPYIPYTAQPLPAYLDAPLRGIPVSSGGNVTIDGQEYIADYIDWERGKRVQRIRELVLNGAENYILQSINANGIANFVYDLPTPGKNPKGFKSLCNMFQWGDLAIAEVTEQCFFNNDTRAYFRIKSSTASTVEEFKVFVAQNNIQLQYVLATPIETDIPPEELLAYRRLHAYHGTTNIHNSDDVYTAVEYARDPDTYLNNKLAEISAAIIGG